MIWVCTVFQDLSVWKLRVITMQHYKVDSWSDQENWFFHMKWAASWQNQQKRLCAQRRLRSAWASAQSDQSSLCSQCVAKDPSFLQADSEDSDQTGWMPRLIWVFAGRTAILLVSSRCGSNVLFRNTVKILKIWTPESCCNYPKNLDTRKLM